MREHEQNGQKDHYSYDGAGAEVEDPPDDPSGAVAGCLVAVVAGAVGLAVWLHGAGPGIHGAFEGERDLSLVYGELPLMLFGVPALTLTVWWLARAALDRRAEPWPAAASLAAALTAALAALSVLAWGCLLWLEARVEPFVHTGW
ncbi:hypothetical protein ACSMX9_19145 [Streptomyces sp. LE64]|uniref:hypothetical protein n=1 Tax=unclassified Streptomyces TaxID=2593676 RepID=UPI00331EA832